MLESEHASDSLRMEMHMKKILHPLDEREITAWIFIVLLAVMILAFGYLFWQRMEMELPNSLLPGVQIHATVR